MIKLVRLEEVSKLVNKMVDKLESDINDEYCYSDKVNIMNEFQYALDELFNGNLAESELWIQKMDEHSLQILSHDDIKDIISNMGYLSDIYAMLDGIDLDADEFAINQYEHISAVDESEDIDELMDELFEDIRTIFKSDYYVQKFLTSDGVDENEWGELGIYIDCDAWDDIRDEVQEDN